MNQSTLLSQLNDKQQQAVAATEGPVLVLAGAGSGKTRVLTHRIAYIIEQDLARPEEILAVTFTNKAANEIKDRISKLLDNKSAGHIPWAGTFHSICAKILRKAGFYIGIDPSFTIYDPNDQQRLVKDILKDLDIDIKKFSPKTVLSAISSAKNELVTPSGYQSFAQGFFQQTIAMIYPEYQKRLENNQALDFDDLIMRTILLFKDVPQALDKYQTLFKYILVDEYQDTNYAQYTLTKMLSFKHKNIFVVGDDAQSIYKWRGADIRNILNFENDYEDTKVIKLEQNYRSTKTILEASNQIIAQNPNQKQKKLWTENADGKLINIYQARNERSEAKFVAEKIIELDGNCEDIAVLYRTNAQSRVMEEMLINYNIPYRLVGNVKFYDRKEIKDVLAYLRIIVNPKDNISFTRIINTPKRGIGGQTVDKLKLISNTLGKSLLESLNNTNDPIFNNYLPGTTIKKLDQFHSLINKFIVAQEKFDLLDFLKFVLEESKLLDEYQDNTEESLSRIENIKEFINIAAKYKGEPAKESLETFLEEISLLEEQSREADNDPDSQKVTLMTIHSAKGLEFKYVFVMGLEENLFPHSRSYLDPEEMEEERRLAYVAFTRAKEELILTFASNRFIFGTQQDTIISRFVEELPQELVEYADETDIDTSLGSGWKEVSRDEGSFDDFIDLNKGDRVKSEYFGIGEVLSVDEDIIKVKFASGIKELATEYARLEKI